MIHASGQLGAWDYRPSGALVQRASWAYGPRLDPVYNLCEQTGEDPLVDASITLND